MKRFIVTAALTAVIMGSLLYFMPQTFDKAISGYVPSNATVSVYCRDTTLNHVDMGCGKKVCCAFDDYAETVKRCGGIDGLSVSFNGSLNDVYEIARRLRLDKLTVSRIDEVTVARGYTKVISGGVIIDGVKINCQIAYSNGIVTVGFPLILGDY